MSDLYDNLRKSPLFNLSLASKELFHSNFIAWYAENYRDNFIDFINEHLSEGNKTWKQGWDDKWKVLRESNNYDICIKDSKGNVRLIIENKVKSIPYSDQLKRYKCKILQKEKDNICFILMALSTDFSDAKDIEDSGWTIINYRELSDFLKKKHTINDTEYKNQLIHDYAGFISNLQNLETQWCKEILELDKTPFLFNLNTEYENAKRLRIHDLYGKIRSQRICSIIKEQLMDIGIIDINIGWNFTNGAPILEVKKTAKDFSKSNQGYEEIFIQIQGVQYRHAVNLVNRSDNESFSKQKQKAVKLSDKGKEYLKQYEEFYEGFPNYKKNVNGEEVILLTDGKTFSTDNNTQIKNYCQYGGHINGGLNSFVYYYKKISPYATIQDIILIVVEDVKKWMDSEE